MINPKYFSDMQAFPEQFRYTYDVTLPDTFPKKPRVIICGMWGSALYMPLVQDLCAHHGIDIRLDSYSSYTLPVYDKGNTLIICASYSGNTEETISCFDEAREDWARIVVFSSGGKLMHLATEYNLPLYQIPAGLQPRLSTGYFISALLNFLEQCWYEVNKMLSACQWVKSSIHVQQAKDLATALLWKTPIIYTTDVLKSMSLISKIKLNENSKTPAFAHYIPELNHNEMCGRMGHTLEPLFIIFTSQFTHPRNLRRVEITSELFKNEWYTVHIIAPQWETLEAEALRIYQFMDYVTYYLAEAQQIDPEPVQMVEDFKDMLG